MLYKNINLLDLMIAARKICKWATNETKDKGQIHYIPELNTYNTYIKLSI